MNTMGPDPRCHPNNATLLIPVDEFVYQVEEIWKFHDWKTIETCRQTRTYLQGVVLVYIRRTPLPPRTWKELKDLLTHRFQPRDLTAAYKAQC